MTSYTRISDDETPSISLDPRNTVSTVDKNIYAGFTEYVLLALLALRFAQ